MSSITNPKVREVEEWFEQDHNTITFTTESGSQYTLVNRPLIKVLIRDSTGEAWKGNWIKVTSYSVQLGSPKGILWETTGVTHFYVATN